jgi:hypothetical protein
VKKRRKRNGHPTPPPAALTPRTEVEQLALQGHEPLNDLALSDARWRLLDAAFGAELPAAWEDVVIFFAKDARRAKTAVAALLGAGLIAARAFNEAGLE